MLTLFIKKQVIPLEADRCNYVVINSPGWFSTFAVIEKIIKTKIKYPSTGKELAGAKKPPRAKPAANINVNFKAVFLTFNAMNPAVAKVAATIIIVITLYTLSGDSYKFAPKKTDIPRLTNAAQQYSLGLNVAALLMK